MAGNRNPGFSSIADAPRTLSPKTQTAYIRAVKNFTRLLGVLPILPAARSFAGISFTWSRPMPLSTTIKATII